MLTLDFGESFSVAAGEPVMELVWTALGNSAKLVIFALAIVVPLSVLGGLVAAYKKDTWIDRTIVNTGLAMSSIPELQKTQSNSACTLCERSSSSTTNPSCPRSRG